MYSDTRATTRSVLTTPEVNARSADSTPQHSSLVTLTDKDIARVAMHPDVLAAEIDADERSLDIFGQPQLAADGWLKHVVSNPPQGVWHEPTAAKRLEGAEVAVELGHVITFAARAGDRLVAEREKF